MPTALNLQTEALWNVQIDCDVGTTKLFACNMFALTPSIVDAGHGVIIVTWKILWMCIHCVDNAE